MLSQIRNIIKTRKPDISVSTVNTHSNNVYRIYAFLFPGDTEFDIEKLEDTPIEIIQQFIDTKSAVTRKCYASAMIIIKRYPCYTQYIIDNNEAYKNRIDAHIPSERDIDSRVTPDKIQEVELRLRSKYDSVFVPDKKMYIPKELQIIRNYILFQLISGRHFPPRRSLDWIAMKIQNINQDTDNYIDVHDFVFNKYKTAYKFGQQRIHIPDELYELLQSYIKITPYEYLIPTNTGKMYQNSNFNFLINEIMETVHGSGSTPFRKAFLQTNFGNIVKLQDTMTAMSSSKNVVNSYITNF